MFLKLRNCSTKRKTKFCNFLSKYFRFFSSDFERINVTNYQTSIIKKKPNELTNKQLYILHLKINSQNT